jgi:hypothetical protein
MVSAHAARVLVGMGTMSETCSRVCGKAGGWGGSGQVRERAGVGAARAAGARSPGAGALGRHAQRQARERLDQPGAGGCEARARRPHRAVGLHTRRLVRVAQHQDVVAAAEGVAEDVAGDEVHLGVVAGRLRGRVTRR